MKICFAKDTLVPLGYFTTKDCLLENLVDIDVPAPILRAYYERYLKKKIKHDFFKWYREYSVVDDMDDFWSSTCWRPKRKEIIE